jgi:hypothetical protein
MPGMPCPVKKTYIPSSNLRWDNLEVEGPRLSLRARGPISISTGFHAVSNEQLEERRPKTQMASLNREVRPLTVSVLELRLRG